MPQVAERYYQVVLPILRLVLAIMISMGRADRDAAKHITGFIAAHAGMFVAILKDHTLSPSAATLEELMLATAIFERLSDHEDMVRDLLQSQGARVQTLLLSLLAKYCGREQHAPVVRSVRTKPRPEATAMASDGEPGTAESAGEQAAAASALVHRICCNLLAYCSTVLRYRSADANANNPVYWRVLLAPTLGPSPTVDVSGIAAASAPQSVRGAAPSMSVLVRYLGEAAAMLDDARARNQTAVMKREHIDELLLDDLDEVRRLAFSPQHRRCGRIGRYRLGRHRVSELTHARWRCGARSWRPCPA